MTLKINGVDIVSYVAYGGFKWQRSDVDGKGAGRSLAGTLSRDRVAIKIRLDVTCRPLTTEESSKILTLIEPEFVTVEYTDPFKGTNVKREMYSNNIPAQYSMKDRTGKEFWIGITFPLIER